MKEKKKTAEILKEIDSNLDTVLSILGKTTSWLNSSKSMMNFAFSLMRV